MTKRESLYQVKLILECLPKEEYDLIPKDTISYIEDNMEISPYITIDPTLDLTEQKIDDKTYEFLDSVINNLDLGYINNEGDSETTNKIIEGIAKPNGDTNFREENIKLKSIIEALKLENVKLPKARLLLEEYNLALLNKEKEITKLKVQVKFLNKCLDKIPKRVCKFFLRGDYKRLIDSKDGSD